MDDDAILLQRYAREGDQAAFAELVRRRVDFVYSVALRRSNGDAHLAQDVTQQVFIALARRAGELARHPALLGWLHRCACQRAADLVRTEVRRRVRETVASSDPALANGSPAVVWEAVAPELDEALQALGERDREVVLARFFERRGFVEIGAQLGVSEAAAQMRATRALEKLRGVLARRGVTSTAAVLGTALSGNAVMAAPPAVAAGTLAAVSGGVVAAAGAGATAGAAVSAATFMSSTKVMVIAAVSVMAVGGAGYGVYQAQSANEPVEIVQADATPAPGTIPKRQAAVSMGMVAPDAATTAAMSAARADMEKKRADARAKLGPTQARLAVPAVSLIEAARGAEKGALAPRATWTDEGKKALQEARAWFEHQMNETGLWTTYGWEDDVARMEFEMEVERRLAAQLTPEEFQDYVVRESVTARLLKNSLLEFGANWPERAAILEIEREFGARWGVYGGKPSDPALLAQWTEARNNADERLRATLGAERFEVWLEAKRGGR